jgi:hypothetical protein
MFPFWIDISLPALLQLVAASVATITWFVAMMTGHCRSA